MLLGRLRPLAVATLVLALVAGCRLASLDPGVDVSPAARATAPLTAGRSAFYPLTLGNRWHYRFSSEIRLEDEVLFRQDGSIDRELACTDAFSGVPYTVEVVRVSYSDGGDGYASTVNYRQDATGLYEHDPVPGHDPPCGPPPGAVRAAAATAARPGDGTEPPSAGAARARDVLLQRAAMVRAAIGWLPAGAAAHGPGARPLAGEIVRLVYPLSVGRSWVIRDDPKFECRVERVEPLALAIGTVQAYRLRITSELFGPDIRVFVWYGRDGFLELELHDRIAITNDNGEVLGVGTFDETDVLESFEPAAGD